MSDTVTSSPVTAVGSLLAHGHLHLRPLRSRLLLQQSSLQCVLCPHQCDPSPLGCHPLEAEVISLVAQGQQPMFRQQLHRDTELLPAMRKQPGCCRQSTEGALEPCRSTTWLCFLRLFLLTRSQDKLNLIEG